MKQILKLVFLLVIGQTAFAQAPSNYTNINGRYRWIAGMFDSTFHIPKGTNPSLRTGGSTNSGGLFYNTSDSSVYTYTGTQWIKLRGSINPSDTTNKYVTQVYKKSGSDSIFYVKGGVHTWAFNDSTGSPGGGGGGKVYYFNGGVSMGTFGGFAMYELGDTANTGAAANFTRSTTGNIANFITDPGKPGLLQIPAGVWSVDAWLSETGGGANHAEIWIEVEKWDGSTITTIATSPIEQITEGATPNLYSWSVSIPTTSLTVTDRIVIQFYISNTNGKTVTLYTQNGYVGEVHTTFTTGIGAINGLTAPAQYLVTGTSGTDFNINSATATHTFNLPTASATNRGALSTTDWSTFNNKIGGSLVSGYLTKATGTNTIDTSQIFQSSGRIGVSTTSPQTRLMVAETASDGALGILGNASNVGTFKFYANNGSTIQSVVNSSSSAMQIGTFVNSEMNLITNSATRVSILNNGNVGIGSGAATDSMLTVENGARFKRGVRMSALPTGVGTKALRIDANGTLSVADTLANPISGTGTTNYVTKWTSSSAVGNSQIFDNGTNVGIGTNTPSRTLDVNGIITTNNNLELTSANPTILWTTSNLRFYNNTNGVVATISSAGQLSLSSIPNATTDTDKFLVSDGGVVKYRTGSEVLSDIGAASSSSISGTTNYIPKFTSSSAIGNGNLYDNNGDIVINGTTPQNESSGRGSLTINGTQAVLSLSTSNTNAAYLYHNATDLFLYNAKNGVLAFGTNNTERMRLDASGNLGIGTSSPAYKLDVSGTGRFVGALTNPGIYISGNLNGTRPATNEGLAIGQNFQAGTVDVGFWNTYLPSTFANTKFSWYQLTSASTSTELMTLTASGNLGLGVTPSAWSGRKVFQIDVSSLSAASGNMFLGSNYYDNGTNNLYINNGYALLYAHQSGSHIWYNSSNGTAGNAITFTQAMTLDASGRLGIGSTSPENKLTIIQNTTAATENTYGIAIQSVNTNAYTELLLGASDAVDAGIIQTAAKNTNFTAKNLALQPQGGKVGIGTTSPTGLLHLYGADPAFRIQSSTTGNMQFGQWDGTYNRIQSSGRDFNLISTDATNLLFSTNGSERMRITSGGDVGIGTTADLARTTILSDANAQTIGLIGRSVDNISTIRWWNNAGNTIYTAIESNANYTIYNTVTNGYAAFLTNNTERMRITSGGELLINTTSDAGDYKLQVNGNGLFTGSTNAKFRIESGTRNINFESYSADWNYIRTNGQNFVLGTQDATTLYLRTNDADRLTIASTGEATFSSSIKTAAPSGGTAKPWKLGQAGVSVGGANTTAVAVEIDGTVYYLLTAYLPEPEPDPAALPSSGPSASYKPYNKPIPVKTTKDVEIENLRKEIEELKQLIKNK